MGEREKKDAMAFTVLKYSEYKVPVDRELVMALSGATSEEIDQMIKDGDISEIQYGKDMLKGLTPPNP